MHCSVFIVVNPFTVGGNASVTSDSITKTPLLILLSNKPPLYNTHHTSIIAFLVRHSPVRCSFVCLAFVRSPDRSSARPLARSHSLSVLFIYPFYRISALSTVRYDEFHCYSIHKCPILFRTLNPLQFSCVRFICKNGDAIHPHTRRRRAAATAPPSAARHIIMGAAARNTCASTGKVVYRLLHQCHDVQCIKTRTLDLVPIIT